MFVYLNDDEEDFLFWICLNRCYSLNSPLSKKNMILLILSGHLSQLKFTRTPSGLKNLKTDGQFISYMSIKFIVAPYRS